MITIFTSPKPFEKEAEANQLNALLSWRAIHPDIEIVIFGDVPGAAGAAAMVKAKLISEFTTSNSGAPSFNYMVNFLNKKEYNDLQLYVNADIILDSSILEALFLCNNRFNEFLMVGERLDLAPEVNVISSNNSIKINAPTKEHFNLHGPSGVDYFGFKRGMWKNLKTIYMGRALCDQAILNHCLLNSIPLIDATLKVEAYHQYHGYFHVKGGRKDVFQGVDTKIMAKEHNLKHSVPTIADANWILTEKSQIIPDYFRKHKLRKIENIIRYRFKLFQLALLIRVIQRFFLLHRKYPKLFTKKQILNSWKLTLLSIDKK
jgi:hypothetical protein